MHSNELLSPPLSPKVRGAGPPVGPPRRKSGPPAPLPLGRKSSLDAWDRKGEKPTGMPNYPPLGIGSGFGLAKPAQYRMPKMRNNSTGVYEGKSHTGLQFAGPPSPRRASADDTYAARKAEQGPDIGTGLELPTKYYTAGGTVSPSPTPPTPPKQTDTTWQPDYGGLSLMLQLGQPTRCSPTKFPRTSSYNNMYGGSGSGSPAGSPPLSPRRASADVPSVNQLKPASSISDRRKSVGDAPGLRGCISPTMDSFEGFVQIEVSVVSAVDPSSLPILLKLKVTSEADVHMTEVLASPLPIPFGAVQVALDCPQKVSFELLGSTTATGSGDPVGSCSFMLTKQMVKNLPVTLNMSLREGSGDIFQETVAELCVQMSMPTTIKERNKSKRVSFAFDDEIKPTPETENSSPVHNLDPLSIETELHTILPLPLSPSYDDKCCSYDYKKRTFIVIMIVIIIGIVVAMLAALGVIQ